MGMQQRPMHPAMVLDELCASIRARVLRPPAAADVHAGGLEHMPSDVEDIEDEEQSPPEAAENEQVIRFHMTPKKGWDRFARGMRCDARNLMNWKGKDPLPPAPRRPCWLLPTSDETAIEIARRSQELMAIGWKILPCDHELMQKLSNKALLRDYAEERGLAEFLPRPYRRVEDAEFPCILRSADGEFGKDCHIVNSEEQVRRLAPRGLGEQWVLQELIYGSSEQSTAVVADKGRLLYHVSMYYNVKSEAYVYPTAQKLGKGPFTAPDEHLAVMSAFLRDYFGVCNFNYKVRPDGRMCIFELNTRMTGDLVTEAPRPLSRG